MFVAIRAHAGMCPPGRNDNRYPRGGFHGKATARVLGCELLHVDKGLTSPDFIDFRSCPSTVRGNFVDVSLAANHFVPQPALRVSHDAKQEHPLLKLRAMHS